MKDEVLKKLEELEQYTKDYNLFKHLYSGDKGISTLARINQLLGKIRFMLETIDVKQIKTDDFEKVRFSKKTLVKIRPCNKEYGDKTFIGIYIGDIPAGFSAKIEKDTITIIPDHYNPAIYIPDINKVVFGYESWWGEIESIDDLKNITDEDVDNTWYVKLFKKIEKNSDNGGTNDGKE